MNEKEFKVLRHGELRNKTLKYLLFCLVAFGLMMICTITCYVVQLYQYSYNPQWILNIFFYCYPGQIGISVNEVFLNNAFIKSARPAGIFGAYLGIIIDSLYLGGTPSDYNNVPIWKLFLRLVVGILILSPLILLNQLISKRSNTMVIFFFAELVPYYVGSLIAFSLLKVVYRKLKLEKVENQ